MKKTILGIAFMAIASLAVSAQTQNTAATAAAQTNPTEYNQTTRPSLYEGLNLTDTQKEQIRDLNAAMAQSRKELKAEQVADNNQLKDAATDLREKYIDQMEKILSHDQFVNYLKNCFVNAPNRAPGQKYAKGGNRVENVSMKGVSTRRR